MKTTFIVLLQCIKTNQTLNKLIVLAIIVTIGFPYNIQNLFLEPKLNLLIQIIKFDVYNLIAKTILQKYYGLN